MAALRRRRLNSFKELNTAARAFRVAARDTSRVLDVAGNELRSVDVMGEPP